MRILFLGHIEVSPLVSWLIEQKETIWYAHARLTVEEVRAFIPDIIISYNYKYLLQQEVLDIPPLGAINLHISYLPFNRGSDPNPWSFIDNTPAGVTIHHIDGGIDTGDIIAQVEIVINKEKETLASSYALLHNHIQKLFRTCWYKMRTGNAPRSAQEGAGTYHASKDRIQFAHIIEEYDWDIPINEFLTEYGGGAGK